MFVVYEMLWRRPLSCVCVTQLCLCSLFQASMDIPGLNLSQQEYYPYVYYKIDCNLLDFKV